MQMLLCFVNANAVGFCLTCQVSEIMALNNIPPYHTRLYSLIKINILVSGRLLNFYGVTYP